MFGETELTPTLLEVLRRLSAAPGAPPLAEVVLVLGDDRGGRDP